MLPTRLLAAALLLACASSVHAVGPADVYILKRGDDPLPARSFVPDLANSRSGPAIDGPELETESIASVGNRRGDDDPAASAPAHLKGDVRRDTRTAVDSDAGQCFTDLVVGQDIEVRGLLEGDTQGCEDGIIESAIAGRVCQVGDDDGVVCAQGHGRRTRQRPG